MKLIGIDFGWVSGASGLCCLEWHNETLHLLNFALETQIEAILTLIDTWIAKDESALIAVDAPTLIPNQTGMRLADKLTHKHFGRYHAGCYPANLQRPFAQRTIAFGRSLENRGFQHAATINPQQQGRYQIEVFPHPAMVNLFQLSRIIKYKKGKLADRKIGLKQLRAFIFEVLPYLQPALRFTNIDQYEPLTVDFENLNGKQVKAVEDQLDGLICAYIAAYWWYWGTAKNLVLGDITTGYIVIPCRPS
jgi:predicted RNase H-like nuclease